MCAACLNSPAGWWPFGFMFACLCWPRALSPQQLQIQHIWSCWASFGWSNTRNVVSWFFWGGGCSDHFIAEGVTQRGFPCVHSTASVVWSSAVSLKGVWILFPFTAFKKQKSRKTLDYLRRVCSPGNQLFVRHKTKIIFSSSHNKGRRWQLFSNLPTKTSLCDKNKSVNPWE